MNKTGVESRDWGAVDVILIVLAIAVVVLLAGRLGAPSDSGPMTNMRQLIDEAERNMLSNELEPIATRDSDEMLQIGSQTLVLVFRSDCVFCELTAPIWEQLADEFGEILRVVALNEESLEIAESWLASWGISVDEIRVPTISLGETWGSPGVPVTILTAPDGRVAWVKIGRLAEGEAAGIRRELQTFAHRSIGGALPQIPQTQGDRYEDFQEIQVPETSFHCGHSGRVAWSPRHSA